MNNFEIGVVLLQNTAVRIEKFGSKYPDNPVTESANDYNDDQWSEFRDQKDNLYEVCTDLDRCRYKYDQVIEDAEKNDCQCVKTDF